MADRQVSSESEAFENYLPERWKQLMEEDLAILGMGWASDQEQLRREIEEARSCAAACDVLTATDPSRQAQPDLGRLDEAKLWYMGQRRRLEEETRRLETELEEAKEETRRQLDARGKWGGNARDNVRSLRTLPRETEGQESLVRALEGERHDAINRQFQAQVARLDQRLTTERQKLNGLRSSEETNLADIVDKAVEGWVGNLGVSRKAMEEQRSKEAEVGKARRKAVYLEGQKDVLIKRRAEAPTPAPPAPAPAAPATQSSAGGSDARTTA